MSGSGGSPEVPSMSGLEAGDPRAVGPFTVHGRLGAGGMGVVYAAVGPNEGWVALKVIRSEYTAQAEFRSRFAREIDLMGRVKARCTAPLLAHDAAAPQPWYATAYIPGPTLSQQIAAHGALSPDRARLVAAGMAEAIAAIHAAGIVHRDLKPANVILSPYGPMVLDFGIARALDETAVTRTGVLVGSPGWMSPERYRGHTGPEDDLFAWGALTAYAATGRPPFGAGGAETLMYRVLNEEPDLHGLPEDLVGPVAAALSKDPAERPSATALLQDLTQHADPAHAATAVTTLIHQHWTPPTPPAAPTTSPPPEAPAPPWPNASTPQPDTRSPVYAPAAPPPPTEAHRRSGLRRSAPALIVAASAALALTAAGAVAWLTGGEEPASEEGEPLQLGFLLHEVVTSGDHSGTNPAVSAVELARQEINEAGGVLGIRLPELLRGDTSDNNAFTTVEAAESLISEGAHAVVGAPHDETTMNIYPYFTDAETVLCAGASHAPEFADADDDGYLFRTSGSALLEARVMAGRIIDDGGDEVAVVARNDLALPDYAEVLAEELERRGADVVHHDFYHPADPDFDRLVDEVGDSAADAVAVAGSMEATELLTGLLADDEERGIYVSQGLIHPDLGELVAPDDPDSVSGITGFRISSDATDFHETLAEFSGEPDLANEYSPNHYDCVIAVALAAEVAGSSNPADFAGEMQGVTRDGAECFDFAECRDLLHEGEDIDYQGASGPLRWDANGDPTTAPFVVFRYNDEEWVPVDRELTEYGS